MEIPLERAFFPFLNLIITILVPLTLCCLFGILYVFFFGGGVFLCFPHRKSSSYMIFFDFRQRLLFFFRNIENV
jgi:hypothetical protein